MGNAKMKWMTQRQKKRVTCQHNNHSYNYHIQIMVKFERINNIKKIVSPNQNFVLATCVFQRSLHSDHSRIEKHMYQQVLGFSCKKLHWKLNYTVISVHYWWYTSMILMMLEGDIHLFRIRRVYLFISWQNINTYY